MAKTLQAGIVVAVLAGLLACGSASGAVGRDFGECSVKVAKGNYRTEGEIWH